MMKRRTPAQMARLVARWRASDEAQTRFAQRAGVAPWTFWYWCRKLANAPAPPARRARSTSFVPVQVVPEPRPSAIEIVLPGGERVHVGAGASAALLREVITVLRAAC
jgi:hypothetical protein